MVSARARSRALGGVSGRDWVVDGLRDSVDNSGEAIVSVDVAIQDCFGCEFERSKGEKWKIFIQVSLHIHLGAQYVLPYTANKQITW
jgi:hypothetical protein